MKLAPAVIARALLAPHAAMVTIAPMASSAPMTPVARKTFATQERIAPTARAYACSTMPRSAAVPPNAQAAFVKVEIAAPVPVLPTKTASTALVDATMGKTVTTMPTPVRISACPPPALAMVQPAARKVAPQTTWFAPTKTATALSPMGKAVTMRRIATVVNALMIPAATPPAKAMA